LVQSQAAGHAPGGLEADADDKQQWCDEE
jgi:hypothetical protein